MHSSELYKYRNSEGYIDLNHIDNVIPKKIDRRGRTEKKWYIFDDIKTLFKLVTPDTYQDYMELLVEELYNQIGAETAHYDLAILDGKKGVITPDFLNESGKLISGKIILESLQNIEDENRGLVGENQEVKYNLNNLVDTKEALCYYMSERNADRIMEDLDVQFGIDCLTLQLDRHSRNWSLIRTESPSSKRYELSPQYDSSSALGCIKSKRRISNFLKCLEKTRKDEHRRKIINEQLVPSNWKNLTLKYDGENSEHGMNALRYAFEKDPIRMKKVIDRIKNISPEKAVESVEERINAPIEEECKEWFINIINFNLRELGELCKSEKDSCVELERN